MSVGARIDVDVDVGVGVGVDQRDLQHGVGHPWTKSFKNRRLKAKMDSK